jgi:DMSO/TMAO reductase YedYZ molybdopterin-dependent catalytic subunit
VKKTFFVVAGTIIMLAVVSLAYNRIPSASSADSTYTVQEWRLIVTGLVNNPLNLSWAEIVAMPKTTVNAALVCVDAPNVLMAGNWTGIKLRTLFEEAEISTAVIKVGFYAADGYSTDLTIETAMRDDIILAYEKDGNPLNDLRLVVPGKWGYKWINQVTVIQLVDYNFLGRWESEGYSDEADISPSAQSLKDLQSLFKSLSPDPSPTPTPTTSPSPSSSQPPIASPAPSQEPTPTPKAPQGLSLPLEAVYAAAASVAIVIVVFGVIVVRKRAK